MTDVAPGAMSGEVNGERLTFNDERLTIND